MNYEAGLKELLRRLGPNSAQYVEALTFEGRLNENMRNERLYGSTESLRSERAAIVHQLNTLALGALGVSFNELAVTAPARAGNAAPQPAARADAQPSVDHKLLRDVLQEQFNVAELQELCFELSVPWEDVAGASKSVKVIELITYMQRRGRLAELAAAVRAARPGAL